MSTGRNISRLLIAATVVLVLPKIASVEAQNLPRSLTIGSNPPGTVFYALASGLAKVVSETTPMQMTVQPYTGTSTFMPLLNSGELDFGIDGVKKFFGPAGEGYVRLALVPTQAECERAASLLATG